MDIHVSDIPLQGDEESPEVILTDAEVFELNSGDRPMLSAFCNRFDLPTAATTLGKKVNDYREKYERTDGDERNRRHATDFILLKVPEWVKFHEMLS